MKPGNSLKRILMIEDEPDIRTVAELALEARHISLERGRARGESG